MLYIFAALGFFWTVVFIALMVTLFVRPAKQEEVRPKHKPKFWKHIIEETNLNYN